MNNLRNVITFVVLMLALAWLGGQWAYRSVYLEPRTKLRTQAENFTQGIQTTEANIAMMKSVIDTNGGLFYRSFPRIPGAVQSHYPIWLTQLAEFCGIEEPTVGTFPPQTFNFGIQYRYQLGGRGTMEQLTRFLYEFYWNATLHRILNVNITPIEKSDSMNIVLQIEGLALSPGDTPNSLPNPYPSQDQFPAFYWRRLASGPFRTYEPISSRNLLQYARSGIDQSDYTYLVVVAFVDGVPEIHLKNRTNEQTIVAKVGDKVQVGSFTGSVRAVTDTDDVLFELPGGQFWLLGVGEALSSAYPLPPELGFLSEL